MGEKGWQSISIRRGIYEKIRERVRSKRVGGAINEALMFLVMEDFFAYSDPYEWLEAKAKELCGELTAEVEAETAREAPPSNTSFPFSPTFFGTEEKAEAGGGEGFSSEDDGKAGFILEF